MFAKLLAMFIGNRIDRSDGRGGVKGAIFGLAAERAVRGRLGVWGWIGLALVALWKLFFGRRRTKVIRRTTYR
jgi:hypothetical protein